MQEEIEYRKLVVRKEALEDVKEARAQGDLSENFEYYAAKKFKNKNESRIRFLERMIKTAEVVSDESAADEVGMNNKVEVLSLIHILYSASVKALSGAGRNGSDDLPGTDHCGSQHAVFLGGIQCASFCHAFGG